MAKRKAAAAGDAGAAVQQPVKQQRVDAAPDVAAAKQKRSFKNKEKVLVLGTRGITYRYAAEPSLQACKGLIVLLLLMFQVVNMNSAQHINDNEPAAHLQLSCRLLPAHQLDSSCQLHFLVHILLAIASAHTLMNTVLVSKRKQFTCSICMLSWPHQPADGHVQQQDVPIPRLGTHRDPAALAMLIISLPQLSTTKHLRQCLSAMHTI
jgi:hypothetical protein